MNKPRISRVWILCDLGQSVLLVTRRLLGLFAIDLAESIKEGEVSGVQAPKDDLILNLE